MKNSFFIILIAFLAVSCSNNDEPSPEIFQQLSEITDGESISQKISYDEYGRVIKYVATYPGESVEVAYSYPSENLIKIHTQNIIFGQGDICDIIRKYDDEMYLEKGRASYCEGIFSTNELGVDVLFQKKYRHDFSYTADNRLNVVKCTEWNKSGDDWAYDRPWSWEIYYIWADGNLIEIEDFAGHSKPTYTYKYSYSTITGVENIVPVHYGRFQYYPLQLKGVLGAQSTNLVTAVESALPREMSLKKQYEYDISTNKITGYTEIMSGVAESYSVVWTE